MREETAKLVYPVLLHGLGLKERLDRGETPSLDVEQAVLRSLLLSENEARRWPAFGGVIPNEGRASESAPARPFLGLRYALTCWLDELFIRYSSWETPWNENKLEMALYGTNDRAWKFWEQVRSEETRPGSEALEGIFLLVMLGFRGELDDDPDRLESWVAATRPRVQRGLNQPWITPPRLEPTTAVPPLRQRQRLRRAILVGGVFLLLLIPLLTHFLVRQLGQ